MGIYGVLDINNYRENLVDASEIFLKFTCPECGSDHLREISEEIIPCTGIVSRHRKKDGGRRFWDHEFIDYEYGNWYFECRSCGYVLEDDSGNRVLVFEELADWLMKNCEQDDVQQILAESQ